MSEYHELDSPADSDVSYEDRRRAADEATGCRNVAGIVFLGLWSVIFIPVSAIFFLGMLQRAGRGAFDGADVVEIVGADHQPGNRPGVVKCGEEKRGEHERDGAHRYKLHQGKSTPLVHHLGRPPTRPPIHSNRIPPQGVNQLGNWPVQPARAG